MNPTPLAVTYRMGRIEGIHDGSVAVVDSFGGLLHGINNSDYGTYLRSSIKMIQAIPVIRSGAADKFGFTDAEISICCASHIGADYHLETVRGMLEKIGLGEEHLNCGAHFPDDVVQKNLLLCSDHKPGQLHNNCSGKHAGMLAACLAKGWPIENYLDINHPLQQWIYDLIAEYSGVPKEDIGIGIDGCSLPTFYMSLSAGTMILARFVEQAKLGDEAAERIMKAVTARPEMINGHGGFDTELVRVMGGRCIAKRGAMAVFLLGIDSGEHGVIGIGVKLEHGDSGPMPVVVMHVLDQLGVLTAEESEALDQFRKIELKNWNGIHVGETIAEFDLRRTTEFDSAA